MRIAFLLIAAVIAAMEMQFAAATGNIIDFTNENFFKSLAYPSDSTEKYKAALVLWYTDSCFACREIAAAIREAGKVVDGLGDSARRRIFLGKMNAGTYQRLAREEKIEGIPTVKLYSRARPRPIVLRGDFSVEYFEEILLKEFNDLEALDKSESEEREGL